MTTSPPLFCAVFAVLGVCFTTPSLSAQATVSGGRFQAPRPVAQSVHAAPLLQAKLAKSARAAISLASGDFFEDGANGLITGYALGENGVISSQKGVSILPRAEELDTVSPFSASANLVELGVRPDFLKNADLNGDGHQDLVAAARGGAAVQVLLGDGKGNFAAPSTIGVRGTIASLATVRTRAGKNLIAIGVCSSGCSVQFFSADGTALGSVALADTPSLLVSAHVNGSAGDDLIAGGASSLVVLDASSALTGSPRVDKLPVSGAVAVAPGLFVYDGRGLQQIAVLTAEGSVHIFARQGIQTIAERKRIPNARQLAREHKLPQTVRANPLALAWYEAEMLAGVAAPSGSGTPLLVRARVSASGMDDLVAMNVNGGKTTTIRHAVVNYAPGDGPYGGSIQTPPAQVEVESSANGEIAAVLPMRASQQSGMGLVTANREATPAIAQLGAYKTYTVNTTADGAPNSTVINACKNGTSGCTLRGALAAATTDASTLEGNGKADTINIPAGTYTLSYNNPDANGDAGGYHIEIAAPVNLIGAGTVTITTSNKDKIFSENSGDDASENGVNIPGIDLFMSNMTLTNGTNVNNYATNGNYDSLAGIMDCDTGGTGYITFANVNMTNGTSAYGEGGALVVTDGLLENGSTYGSGTLEVDGGTFSGNQTSENGGAISTESGTGEVPMILNGVTISGNSAKHTLNTSDTYGYSSGGGVFFATLVDLCSDHTAQCTSYSSAAAASAVLNSIFSGNTATSNPAYGGSAGDSQGGGLYAAEGLTITNSQFLNNSSDDEGGGIYLNAVYVAPVLTGNTITGNQSLDGGGLYIFNDNMASDGFYGKAVTVEYNVIASNTTTGTGNTGRTGIAVGCFANGSRCNTSGQTDNTVNALYNFWGCNGAATGTGCNTAASNDGTINVSPYAAVQASFNTPTPTAGTSFTLTGGITRDSNGIALSNLNAFTGVTGSTSTPSSGVTVTNPGGLVKATLTIAENGSNLATQSGVATNTSATASLSATPTAATTNGTGTVTILNATATATFTVTVASPTVAISFNPTSTSVNGTSTLSFALSNPNASVALNGVAVTTTLVSGLTVAGGGVTANNCGGTATATSGSSTISLSGITINAVSNCTVSVSVTPTTSGNKSVMTGSVTATNESASGSTSNTVTLTVISPITLSEVFGTASVQLNGSTSMTFTLTNPNSSTSATGIAFTDGLPSGLVIATPNALNGVCGGTVTATAGSSSLTLAGGTLAANASCMIAVNVTGTTGGSKINTTGTVSSNEGGTGSTTTATLIVVAPPTIAAAFSKSQILLNGSDTITFTLTNTSQISQTGVAFSGTLPGGTAIATPSGSADTCGGTLTATAGTSTYSLAAGSIAESSSCIVSFNITGTAVQTDTVTSGTVSSTTGGTGTTASAMFNVVAVPTLSLSAPATVERGVNSTVTATYTLTAGALAPTANFSLYAGATLVSSVAATMTSPTTYTIAFSTATIPSGSQSLTVQYPGDSNYPMVTSAPQAVYVVANNIWVGNSNSTTSALLDNGTALLTTPLGYGGVGVAIDGFGNVWSLNKTNSVAKFTNTGGVTSSGYTGGGLSTPLAIAIDGAGTVWITNTTNSLSEFTSAGVPVTSTAYTDSLNTPASIAIDISGNLWIANSGNNTVTEVLGAAAPTVSPLSVGVQNNTLGTKP